MTVSISLRLAAASLLAATVLVGASARAEIAPDEYAKMQRAAPEGLRIRVDEVETSTCWFWLCSSQDVTVEASVLEVLRSAAGLRAGDRIVVKYVHRPLRDDESGPRAIPILEEDDVVPAWLAKAEGASHFVPAARGASFEGEIPLP